MKIFELDIPKLESREFLEEITDFITSSHIEKWRSIFTPNPEICLATLKDAEFLEVLQNSDYQTSDGIGLYLGYQISANNYSKIINIFLFPYYLSNVIFRKKYLYTQFGDRICGSDLTKEVLDIAEKEKLSIAILDMPAWDEWKQKSQDVLIGILKEKYPNIHTDLYIYTENTQQDIFNKISKSNATVLFSTLGMKQQELSVRESLGSCPNIKLGLGIGSSFDYFTGFQKRAPKLWRDIGLEWLYRIFTSPNKLNRLRRIYSAVIIFPLKVLFDKGDKKN